MARTKLRGLTIAGLRIAIEAPASLPWRFGEGPLRRFASAPDDPDVVVGVRVARVDEPPAELRYDSGGGIFDVARDGSDWLIALRIRGELQRLARFDEHFRVGEVVVAPDSFYAREAHYPLAYPLDEVLFLHRLAREQGLLIHACGVTRGRRALLFTGRSGAGKTTIARWAAARGAEVLSDDRIVLRPDGTRFRAYGTPWHGDGELSATGSARVDAVHAIQQGARLEAQPLAGADAAAAVLANAFVPVHDPIGAAASLRLVERLVGRVPVVRLEFPKDPRVVSFAWGELPRVDAGTASAAL